MLCQLIQSFSKCRIIEVLQIDAEYNKGCVQFPNAQQHEEHTARYWLHLLFSLLQKADILESIWMME